MLCGDRARRHLIDNDAEKISRLQQGEVPIHEEHLPELLERHRGKRLLS